MTINKNQRFSESKKDSIPRLKCQWKILRSKRLEFQFAISLCKYISSNKCTYHRFPVPRFRCRCTTNSRLELPKVSSSRLAILEFVFPREIGSCERRMWSTSTHIRIEIQVCTDKDSGSNGYRYGVTEITGNRRNYRARWRNFMYWELLWELIRRKDSSKEVTIDKIVI